MSYKLSICMIVKNEERNLKRCLDSIKMMTDNNFAELIIVDTGSTDSSVEIVKNYTDKIYYHKWNDNFADMRNISISYATGEWILILDADEELENPKKFMDFFHSDLSNYKTIVMNLKNYVTHSKDKVVMNTIIRAFKNEDNFEYIGRIHEQPVFKRPVFFSDLVLNHYGYNWEDEELRLRKFKRTEALLREELEQDPNNAYYQYQLAASWFNVDIKRSYLESKKAFNLIKNKNNKLKFEHIYIFGLYAKTAFEVENYLEVIEISKEGIRLAKDYIDFWYLIAMSYEKLKNKSESMNYGEQFLSRHKNFYSTELSKDPALSFYNVDVKSVEDILVLMADTNIEEKNYHKAENYLNQIESKRKNPLIVKFAELKKDKDIILSYLKSIFDEEEKKESFIYEIEKKINLDNFLKPTDILKFYEDNKLKKDIYLQLNILRMNKSNSNSVLDDILEINFDKAPLYYSDLINFIFEKRRDISILEKLGKINNLEKMLNYLLISNKLNLSAMYNYIIENKRVKNNYNLMFWNKLCSWYLCNVNITEENSYVSLFDSYIDNGETFIKLLYREELLDDEYVNYIENSEHRFFFNMKEYKKYHDTNSSKSLEYLKKALRESYLEKGIKIKLEEMKQTISKDTKTGPSSTFESYKINVKNRISSLVEKNELAIASNLVKEYESIVKEDIEIYSIKGIIELLRGNYEKSEEIFIEGLKLDSSNFDLLFNLGHLYSILGQIGKSKEVYKKALQSTKSDEKKMLINQTLDKL